VCALMTLGCLWGAAIAFAPRVVIIFAWLFSDRWSAVWDNWFVPTLGFIFLPYTTIMYALSWNAITGVSGWDWMWIFLGFLLDVSQWAGVISRRREFRYYSEAYP
jgi:hypothetical protein